jgi:predicted anti-sigma-YlaC factor YlaD
VTHCTMDDLVALRANEGSVWARKHLEACDACRAELDALYQRIAQLRALPARSPARDRWQVVREQVVAQRHQRRRAWAGWSLAAAAALSAIVIFRPFAPGIAAADEVAQAQRASAQLESTLHQYSPDGRVESGSSASLAAQLEDQIASVDGVINRLGNANGAVREDSVVGMWRQRVQLMRQLVQVRVTRASYVGL